MPRGGDGDLVAARGERLGEPLDVDGEAAEVRMIVGERMEDFHGPPFYQPVGHVDTPRPPAYPAWSSPRGRARRTLASPERVRMTEPPQSIALLVRAVEGPGILHQ